MLDDGTRAALARTAQALERAGLEARFELPEKLHVTLAFLGSVQADRVTELRERLRAALEDVSGFRVQFDTIGGFPNNKRARIAWVGSRHAEPLFVQLADAVRDAARAFAMLDEKKPVLHVTLARLREPSRLPHVALKPCSMNVDEAVLFESLPDEKTTRYEIVERFALTTHASSASASK